MAIISTGKDYIATNFGVGDCFATSGLAWTSVGTDGSTADESGGTASIVGRLVNTAVYREIRITSPRTGTFTYAQLKAANGGQDITLPEVASEIVGVTYCAGTTPTPPPGGITIGGKDYIATNFGVGDCFATSGLSWTAVGTDGSTASETGGTGSIVGRLVNTAVYREIRITSPRTGTFTYAQLKAANGGQDITLPMVSSEIVGVTYCAGAAPPTPPPDNGYSPTPGPSTDIPANMARYWFCTVPGGVNPIINDIKYDTVITPGCSEKNPKWTYVDVKIGTPNKIEFEMLPTFERYDNRCKHGTDPYWPPLVEHQETAIRFALTAAPGAAMGTIQLYAKDIETGEYLSARPSINGIAGEEKFLLVGEKGIKMPLPVGSYEITVTYPGYETPERVDVHLTESYTDDEPYTITFEMKEVKIWKVIEIREKALKPCWIVSFSISTPIIWEIPSAGSITFEFLQEGIYRTYFDLHPMPADWTVDFPIEQLAPSVKRVYCDIEGDYDKVVDGLTLPVLNPILHTNRRYKAPFELIIHAGTVPAGYYIAIASIEIWREVE